MTKYNLKYDSCSAGCYDINTLIVSLILLRQTGQERRLGAQFLQTTRWPQGRKTTPTSALRHTLHRICLFIWAFSTCISLLVEHSSPDVALTGDVGGEGVGEGEGVCDGFSVCTWFLFFSFSLFLSS